jgi:hypothetical protein
MSNNFFPRKSCHLSDNVEKYGGAREAADDNTFGALHSGLIRLRTRRYTPAPTHAHTHTHREMCNTYCFSNATAVFRERASVLRYMCIAFVSDVILLYNSTPVVEIS